MRGLSPAILIALMGQPAHADTGVDAAAALSYAQTEVDTPVLDCELQTRQRRGKLSSKPYWKTRDQSVTLTNNVEMSFQENAKGEVYSSAGEASYVTRSGRRQTTISAAAGYENSVFIYDCSADLSMRLERARRLRDGELIPGQSSRSKRASMAHEVRVKNNKTTVSYSLSNTEASTSDTSHQLALSNEHALSRLWMSSQGLSLTSRIGGFKQEKSSTLSLGLIGRPYRQGRIGLGTSVNVTTDNKRLYTGTASWQHSLTRQTQVAASVAADKSENQDRVARYTLLADFGQSFKRWSWSYEHLYIAWQEQPPTYGNYDALKAEASLTPKQAIGLSLGSGNRFPDLIKHEEEAVLSYIYVLSESNRGAAGAPPRLSLASNTATSRVRDRQDQRSVTRRYYVSIEAAF